MTPHPMPWQECITVVPATIEAPVDCVKVKLVHDTTGKPEKAPARHVANPVFNVPSAIAITPSVTAAIVNVFNLVIASSVFSKLARFDLVGRFLMFINTRSGLPKGIDSVPLSPANQASCL